MTEEKIRKIVKRYHIISGLWLTAFILFAIFLNSQLLKSNLDLHYELGVEYVSGDQGYIWGALIFGLYTLLHLFFYSIEKILLYIHAENSSSS